MVNWYRVFNILKPLCEREVINLKDALIHLYDERDFSLEAIINMTDREVISSRTLRMKLYQLGIKIKGRGGPNHVKPFSLTKEELRLNSVRQLARKYNVHISTVYSRIKKLI